MSKDFRSELFSLCKSIQEKDCTQQIRQLIYDLSVVTEKIKIGNCKPLHGDFAQIARHSNNEFHGYLFLDDNIDSISLPKFFRVEHLSTDERALLERGHRTLVRFAELCLDDIYSKSEVIADSMHPYFLYKPVNFSSEATSFITDEEFQPVVSAFKRGKVYQSLMATDFVALFGQIDINHMRVLIGSIDREISQSLSEDVAKDIKEFSLKIDSKFNNITEVMFAFSVLIFAIKSSLALAFRVLYRAICGVDLFVLNNDNIISIEKNTTTVLCHYYKVFSQDMAVDYSGSEMGSILLLDCDPPYGSHIHEFGMLVSQTLNLAGEFGQSAKYSFVTVNEEMIYIHYLTNEILRIGLPEIKRAP